MQIRLFSRFLVGVNYVFYYFFCTLKAFAPFFSVQVLPFFPFFFVQFMPLPPCFGANYAFFVFWVHFMP